MKSTLMKLKEKTKTWLSPKHQFYNESLMFREYYAAAVLLQTQLSNEITPMDHFELLRLFTFGLQLGREEVKEVICFAKNREKVLEMILKMLDTVEKQTIFLLDLYNMSYTGYGFGEKESEAIEIYGELFQFPKIQMRLLRQLIKEAMDNHSDVCMKIYANMMQLRMSCTLENIRYYIPELEYTTVLDSHAVHPGKTIEINGSCEIREILDIPRDCTLLIHNAKVTLAAPIHMQGGRIDILDSEMEYSRGFCDSMICMEEKGEINIHNTQVYCRNHCSVLKQKGGKLKISESSFYETNYQSAIQFEGEELLLCHSYFYECYCSGEGAAIWAKAENGKIERCNFLHCLADCGGAIYAYAPLNIENCVFSQCHSHQLGKSVYYKGVGQGHINHCFYENTEDERIEVIQEISDDMEIQELRELCVSTCFMKDFSFPSGQSLYAHDVHIYLRGSLRVEGGFSMEHVDLSAYGITGEDLLNVMNASPVIIKDSVLDGGEANGILKATGTKVTLLSSIVKNTDGGRAIYNSVDLLCEDTIFSNCLEGAVYGSRALIRNSTFVNCRSDTGAGIYLVGNKGLIKNCEFNRCIARINGGGISVFGNYPIDQCRFQECEPDDRG